MTQQIFPTRKGKMVDISQTRRDEHGVYGWVAQLDRETRQYVAVPIFVPVAA